ncbi:MAG: VWA domain-containing protein [Chloroflexota bacterium]|nr:VWA domain-containing protein [Chloroflexota bacterium]
MYDDNGPLFQDNDEQYTLGSGQETEEDVFQPEEPVTMDFVPAFQVLPVLAEAQLAYFLLMLRTATHTRDNNRIPLNVCLIVDQSSSMRGDKLLAVKNAARQVVDQLTVTDYFTLISFNDRPTTVVSCQRVSSRESIKSLIDSIDGRGGTEIAQGLYAGIQEMRSALTTTNLNYILLLTDGQTYGDADRCVQLGEEAARRKIVVYPMGIGTDWNEDLLETVAAKSGGSSEYITSPDQIVRIFMQKINQLRGTLTSASSLQFNPIPGGKLRQVHRVSPNIAELETMPNLQNGTECVEMNLGPLGRGSEYSLLMEIVLPPCTSGTYRIGELSVSFSEVGASRANQVAVLPIGFSFANSIRPPQINPEVKHIIEKVAAFKLQAKAWQDIASGDIASGTKRLATVSTRLLNMGEIDLASAVMDEVTNLKQRGSASAEGKKRIKYGTRGLTSDFS